MSKDFYKALNLSESATAAEIKKSFRSLAKKYHPDRNKDNKAAEDKFKELSEAYEVLSDPKKKSEYDNMRKYGAFAGTGGGNGNFGGGMNGTGGFDPSSFQHIFRQGRSGGDNRFEFRSSGGGDDFESIVSQFFGGGQSNRRRQPQKPADLSITLSISFMEAIKGAKKVIRLSNGKKLKVKIPPGIDNNGKIRLAGAGTPGYNRGTNSDLIITVKIMTDQNFERKDNNIFTTVDISFVEAIRGKKVKIKTLTKTIMLTIPPGTQPGTQMRLKGLGLAVGSKQGDQFVTINVEIPTTLTDKQKEILDEW